jgi:hypothetical protein
LANNVGYGKAKNLKTEMAQAMKDIQEINKEVKSRKTTAAMSQKPDG